MKSMICVSDGTVRDADRKKDDCMADHPETIEPLRILLITQEDPFYIKVFFEEFLARYPHTEDILGVVLCPTLGKKSPTELAKQMLDFYGPMDFLRMIGRYLAVKLTRESLSDLCRKFGVPVYREKDINADSFVTNWRGRNIDVIVSVAAPQVFQERLINLPRWGCINIHHAKLPRYRGQMPNFWQMYHSERTAGITVHRINSRIDAGEIILQKEVPIGEEYALDDLIRHSKRIGAQCMIEALGLIQNNKVKCMPNDIAQGSYSGFTKTADVREFRRRGKRIL
jgi:methionyl-tRNA formyltransferase